ncbi:MAG TPA: hypothetical protein ENH01_10215 [Nitrospirae bacterium]|nr:hypothetical protein [Nitrospirota bacterium]
MLAAPGWKFFLKGHGYENRGLFILTTGAEIIPVIKVDNRIIGDGIPGAITRSLTDRFKRYVFK